MDNDFVKKRLGLRCVICGHVIFTERELSLECCDQVHVDCFEKVKNDMRKASESLKTLA